MKLLFTAIFGFFILTVSGQQLNINGTVYDNQNIPLGGVNVVVQNTNLGAITDFDGNYEIQNVPEGSVVEFTYLGFKTVTRTVNSAGTLNVTMEEDAQALDQVVVVGYGTQKRKEITGAVAVLSSETIEELKPQRVEQALQGQVAGVQVTSGSGAPGSALNIRIRGIGTNGDSRPLILVDGNVIEDLSVLNPTDIESINVLKDATAGIYGVRAANGVILITTKSGRKNQPLSLALNTYTGFQNTTRKLPVLNATEYGLLVNESFANGGSQPPFTNVSGFGQGTDWQDEVFKTAAIGSIELSGDGGGENSRYSFSVSYLTQDGIVGGGEKSNFERKTARLNYNLDFLENFNVFTSAIYSDVEGRGILENTIGSVLYNAINNAPTFAVRDSNGEFTKAEGLGNEVINPVAQIENTFNRGRTRKIGGSVGLRYDFLDAFSAEARFQGNYSEVEGWFFSPIVDYGAGKVFNIERSAVGESLNTFKDYTFDAFVKYERSFNDAHNVKVTAGTSVFQTVGEFTGQTGFDIIDNDVANASIAQASDVIDNFPNGGNTFDARLLSYFARAQYDYKGKYLFSAVIRRDGSTKFGPRNKFGYFPSFSAGWVISDEAFMENTDWLDFLKLRASYGIIGNDRIADFGFVSLLNGEGVYVFNEELTFGRAQGRLPNPQIQWEEQETYNIGIDSRFFNSRMNFTVDYFNRRTNDLLVVAPVSGVLGASGPGGLPPVINAGSVENKGVELQLGWRDEINEDFKYNVSGNVTFIQNEVLFVQSDNGFIPGPIAFGVGQDQFISRMEAGQPLGYFFGLQTDGIFQNQDEIDAHALQEGAQPGDIRFVDTNGDGVINDEDRTNIGDAFPDLSFGLNLSFEYKNWDFNAYAFGSLGNDIVRNYERNQQLTNRQVTSLSRWTGPNTSNSFPRVTNAATLNTVFSDFYVEDGSFLRLQNLQVGYSLKDSWLEKLKLKQLRIYASAINLFTLTEYSGFDPTASNGNGLTAGIDQGFYPSAQQFLVGLNIRY
ncbi:SusC/RagA family TonB-linked outer membrane protein [Gilvibacter sp.]|uniref:SusC/RagA family TonB-linked outer membrane protein n=1 Tax=Gilvibacter sp. TaxID=2729997 RepID=UPI003F4A37BA